MSLSSSKQTQAVSSSSLSCEIDDINARNIVSLPNEQELSGIFKVKETCKIGENNTKFICNQFQIIYFSDIVPGNYITLNEIGSGSFGTVYLAEDQISQKLFAVKKIRLDKLIAFLL